MKNNKNESKKTVYEMVTERIIEQLENNIIPWEKPWTRDTRKRENTP